MGAVVLPGSAAILAIILLTIAWIDWHSQRIPDWLNLGLLLSGICFQMATQPDDLGWRAGCAAAATLLFWTVRSLHYHASGRIGLGLGDVKMAGAGAMWVAPALLPFALLVASLTAIAGIWVRTDGGQRVDRHSRVPFGPFLAAGIMGAFLVEQFDVISG